MQRVARIAAVSLVEVVAVVVGVVVAGVASPAHAEGEPEGQDPYVTAGGVFGGGGDSNGFLLPDGSGWAQVCTEAFQTGNVPADFSYLTPDDTLIVGGTPGLGLSTDLGCTFTMVPDLAGRHVSALAVVGSVLFTATNDNGRNNGIWMSIDGGQQWTLAKDEESGLILFDLVASADGQRIVASGARISGTFGPAVFISTDAGISFQDISAPFDVDSDANGQPDLPRVRATTFDTDDSAVLFGGFDGQGKGFVLRSADPYTSFEQIGTFPSEVRHVAVMGGARFALAYLTQTTFRQGAGEADFTQVADKTTGPGTCLFAKPDGSGLLGCGKLGSRAPVSPMFLESSDGTTWSVIVDFPAAHYRECPQGTNGASACARFIEGTQCSDSLDNDVDGLVDCDDPDCASSPACGGGEGEGEGTASEGEGAAAEGEGEGQNPPGCACAGVDGTALFGSLAALLALGRRRQRLLR